MRTYNQNQPVRIGSEDSIDEDTIYLVGSIPPIQECKRFCDQKPDNRNLVVVQDGVITDCYKGLPDEVNNAIFYTYGLHNQQTENPVTQPVKRLVPLKVFRALRVTLTQLTRTQYRPLVKPALKSNQYSSRLEALSQIDFTRVDINPNYFKTIAFQLAQTETLIDGDELYTKKDLANTFPELSDFLYRKTGNKNMLNLHKDSLLSKLWDVYTRTDKELNLFCYKNGAEINEGNGWNQFARQSRGMIINGKTERCIYYPFDKFFRLDEMPESSESALPDHEPEIAEKVDGSMIAVFMHDEELRFACKGNLVTPTAKKAEQIAKKYDFHNLDFSRFHYVFELIHPKNRYPEGLTIVDYGDREELVLIGMRDRLTNEMISYERTAAHATKKGFSHPKLEKRPLTQVIDETKQPGPLDNEGFVANFGNEKYIKVKYKTYMKVLKAVNEISRKRFVKKFTRAKPDQREKMLDEIPQPVRRHALRSLADFEVYCDNIEAQFREIISKHGPEMPQYALEHIETGVREPLLKFWRGRNHRTKLERVVLIDFVNDNEVKI